MASLKLNVQSNRRTFDAGEPCMLGIDEAGRGPVLGPMVYGTSYCPIAKLEDLKSKGFMDSKQLTEQQRDDLFEAIGDCDFMGFAVDIISAVQLSEQMLRRSKYNLNLISHDSAIGLIRFVVDTLKVNVQEVYVDTVGDPNKYQAKLKQAFPSIPTIRVEKKADALFPIVSAASICAKVTRDRELREFSFVEDVEREQISQGMGSGYPSDPKSKVWLRQNIHKVFGFPRNVRFSWGTSKVLLDECAIHMVVPADEEDEEDGDNVSWVASGSKRQLAGKGQAKLAFCSEQAENGDLDSIAEQCWVKPSRPIVDPLENYQLAF